MTENKRFTLTFDDKIVDNLTGIIHDVHSGYDVAMDLSGLLNELNDENEMLKNNMKIKLCNNCIYWRMGTAGLNDNYCSLTDEWADWEGTCEKWKGYHD